MMTKQAELKKQAYASSLKSRALSVLIYLIDRSNKDLTCYPAIPTMAVQLHISISTVKRALKELVDAGYIEMTARFRERNHGQSSNLYTLLFVEPPLEPDEDNISVKADRKDMEGFTAQVPSVNGTIEYVTFAMLVANKLTTQKTSQERNLPEVEKKSNNFGTRKILGSSCSLDYSCELI